MSPLMSTSRTPSRARSPFGSTSMTRAESVADSSPVRVVLPPPLKLVFELTAASEVGSSHLGYSDSSPNKLVSDAARCRSCPDSRRPIRPRRCSPRRGSVTRSLTCRARRSWSSPVIHVVSGAAVVTGSARAALQIACVQHVVVVALLRRGLVLLLRCHHWRAATSIRPSINIFFIERSPRIQAR